MRKLIKIALLLFSIIVALLLSFFLSSKVDKIKKIYDAFTEVVYIDLSDVTILIDPEGPSEIHPYACNLLMKEENLLSLLNCTGANYFSPYIFDFERYFYLISYGAPVVSAYYSLAYTLFRDDSPYGKCWTYHDNVLFYDIIYKGIKYSTLDYFWDYPDNISGYGDGNIYIYRIKQHSHFAIEHGY